LSASGRDSVTNPIDRSSGRFGLAWMDHLSVLNSRIGLSSFPVRVTVGLENNASELVLHVEQTVRACAIDHVGRWMVPRLRGSNHIDASIKLVLRNAHAQTSLRSHAQA
jgi:hypothetical protein